MLRCYADDVDYIRESSITLSDEYMMPFAFARIRVTFFFSAALFYAQSAMRWRSAARAPVICADAPRA